MKIIASDYDGTLNRSGISDSVRKAIDMWREHGNIFGIVTGRGIGNVLSVMRRDNFKSDFFVANNGSVVADTSGNILFCHTGDTSVTCDVCRLILAHGCGAACVNYVDSEVFVRSSDFAGKNKDYITIDSFSDIKGFTQISTVCRDDPSSERLTAVINDVFGGYVSAFQNGICIDIVPSGVDKASGIRKLLELKSLGEDAVCTVGDNNNDLAMIKAFRSYAVQNAIDAVKKTADYTVSDIAELIERELRK